MGIALSSTCATCGRCYCDITWLSLGVGFLHRLTVQVSPDGAIASGTTGRVWRDRERGRETDILLITTVWWFRHFRHVCPSRTRGNFAPN